MVKQVDSATDQFALLANGSCGAWEVCIDESLGPDAAWIAQMEGPSSFLTFQLPDLDAVQRIHDFLALQAEGRSGVLPPSQAGADHWVGIGNLGGLAVSLLADDELPSRCFVVVGPMGGGCLRLTLSAEDTRQLKEAWRQVVEDLGGMTPGRGSLPSPGELPAASISTPPTTSSKS